MAAYYITGIAGTGKSSIAAQLKNHNFVVLDIDTIKGLCHWRHKKTGKLAKYHTCVGKEWLDAHDWICDKEKLKELLNKNKGSNVIVVGIASNQEEYLKYFDRVFLLYCSEETFLERINTRSEGNNFGKDKSEQKQILSWYKDFQEKMINVGAIPINTDEPLVDVVLKIKSEINKN